MWIQRTKHSGRGKVIYKDPGVSWSVFKEQQGQSGRVECARRGGGQKFGQVPGCQHMLTGKG